MITKRRRSSVKPVIAKWKRLAMTNVGMTLGKGGAVKRRPKLKAAPKPFVPQTFREVDTRSLVVSLSFLVPIRTRSLNEKLRNHWKRIEWDKSERTATRLLFPKTLLPVGPGWVVTITRLSPGSQKLDREDNLPGSLKAVRDEVAAGLGFLNDEDAHLCWKYGQEVRASDWAVRVLIQSWKDPRVTP